MAGTKNEQRLRLYRQYEQNLQILKQRSIVKLEPDVTEGFLCPLCFNVDVLRTPEDARRLSLEHVPPRSLGGTIKTTTLLCPTCNNTAGHTLDHNLTRRLAINDVHAEVSGAELDGQFFARASGGRVAKKVGGTLRTTGPGSIEMYFDKRRSNPCEIAKMQDIINDEHVEVVFTFNGDNSTNSSIALLKIAYLEAFRRLGYAFVAPNGSQRVAEQILQPHEAIIPPTWVVGGTSSTDEPGLYLVSEPTKFRSLLVVFDIGKRHKRSERYTVMLPHPDDAQASIYAYRKLVLENKQKVRVTTHQLPNELYLETSPCLFWDIWNG